MLLELDALALDVEEEGASYLADLNKVPDFVDEPPVEQKEVSTVGSVARLMFDVDCCLQPIQQEAVKTTA